MPPRRGSRFLLEVLFILALMVGLALSSLRPIAIAGVMLLGWLIAAAFEWAAWRTEPHFGSGLPPRYYVPRLSLPPAQPLEQVVAGYPESQRDEAPTWIASPALRAEMLGEWPVAAAPPSDSDPWQVAELPPEPEPAYEAEPEPEPEVVAPEPEPDVPELDVELVRSVQGVAHYSLDPLAEPPPRRRFGRAVAAETPVVEVPARPEGVRALPGRSSSQD